MRLAMFLSAVLLCLAGGAGADEGLDALIGEALFNRAWVPAPASTQADDGLGPLFDARSCASCHPKAGRAALKVEADGTLEGRGVVLMLARPDGTPDPTYGRRLSADAVPGLTPEGVPGIRGGKPVVSHLGYGALDPATGMSLRIAPDLRGRGAIQRVPDAALVAVEAEQVGGVGGRVRRVDGAIGRFGWKASQPTLAGQVSEAFLLDLGLSTTRYPEPWGDCTERQPACRAAPHGKSGETPVEVADVIVDWIATYLAAVPAPSSRADPAGERLFAATGCAACHRPTLPTGDGGSVRLFSDLLLHDLGPRLADTMPEPGVSAAEWRTAPLVGIAGALSRRTGLLHDGRARSVEQAITWHGGQASGASTHFRGLSRADREALLRYVSSL